MISYEEGFNTDSVMITYEEGLSILSLLQMKKVNLILL